jgi:hypothetical protein
MMTFVTTKTIGTYKTDLTFWRMRLLEAREELFQLNSWGGSAWTHRPRLPPSEVHGLPLRALKAQNFSLAQSPDRWLIEIFNAPARH